MVPYALWGWYSVFVNETKKVPLFRAYLSRKPSGLILVTVLSTLLPRPLFRMYPAELGEAVAVGRAIRHALIFVLKFDQSRVEHGVDHPVMPPHADHQREYEHDCDGPKHCGEVEENFQHGSPHVMQHASQHAAVSDRQQTGADGYAVKDGHGSVFHLVENANGNNLKRESSDEPRPPFVVPVKVNPKPVNLACNDANANNHPLPAPQPTQHLRLRVVWQGLLG